MNEKAMTQDELEAAINAGAHTQYRGGGNWDVFTAPRSEGGRYLGTLWRS